MSKIGDVIVRMVLKSDDYEKGLSKAKTSTNDFASVVSKGITSAIGKFTAIVGAVAGVIAAVDKLSQANQALGDRFASISAGMRAAWDQLAVSVASLDFSNVVKKMREASNAARDLYNAADAMGEITTSYNIELAKQARTIAQLRTDLADATKSDEERLKAGEALKKIYESLEANPTRGLLNVKTETLDKYLKRMGANLSNMTESQLKDTRRQYENFFVWLGTAQGEAVLSAASSVGKDPLQVNKYFAGTRSGNRYGGAVDENYARWALSYSKNMSDKDRLAIEKAVADYYQQDAKYAEETRRIQTQINTITASTAKNYQTMASAQSVALYEPDLSGIDAHIESLSKLLNDDIFEPLQKISGVGGWLERDIIGEDWLARQEANAERMTAWLEEMQAKIADVSESLTASVQGGVLNAIDQLTQTLGETGTIDGGAVVKALLSPLADACISAGLLIMSTGKGVEALRTALTTGLISGGTSAIVAGAALMAVGAAAKVGLAAIGSGQSASAAAATTTSASAASSTKSNTGGVDSMELTVNIEGKLRGSDIVLASQRTNAAWSR